MKILKTFFYSKNEIPLILLNLLESYDFVDKFLVYEFDHTISGIKKDFVDLYEHWDLFDPYMDKFDYHRIKLDKNPHFLKDESGVSNEVMKTVNEPFMRNYFTNILYLNDDDLIFSVDADEIIYSSAYEKIENAINENDSPVKLYMHFFWKKMNQLTDKRWGNPCASKFKHLKDKLQMVSAGETRYPQWRDEGVNTDFFSGCHFSNCYSNEGQLEYRKQAIFYKPTTVKTTSVDLNSDIMPKKLKEIYPVLEQFNLVSGVAK